MALQSICKGSQEEGLHFDLHIHEEQSPQQGGQQSSWLSTLDGVLSRNRMRGPSEPVPCALCPHCTPLRDLRLCGVRMAEAWEGHWSEGKGNQGRGSPAGVDMVTYEL